MARFEPGAARVAAAEVSARSRRWRRPGAGAGQPAPKSSVRIVASASSRRSLYSGWARLSSESRKRVPATAPSAPASSARRDVGALGDPAGEQQRVARRAGPPGPARAAPGPGRVPRTWPPASTPWTMTASAPAAWADRASATEPHWWNQVPPVRRLGLPQKVTTTSAAAAASNQSRRAKGSSRLTAIGRSGERPGGGQLALDRGGAVDRDRPQPAGLRDRRGQLVAADPAAHPRLDHGGAETDALEDRHPTILRCGS